MASWAFNVVLCTIVLPAVWAIQTPNIPVPSDRPAVLIQNGTLAGISNTYYNQDFFLGIPYATPPIGELRLRKPTSPDAWGGIRQADSYSARCFGNSISLAGFSQNNTDPMDEDCLYLNVIRPSDIRTGTKLPVLVWIHGGGLLEGSASDRRTNGSLLVQTSVKMGSPILFVSFNYRLGAFGMLAGREVEEAGSANLLLYDQRQALIWIQENIAEFGGDASRVTIMGESAGAFSVGFHLLAFGGRDDSLFRGAIAQSGGPWSEFLTARTMAERDSDLKRVLEGAGCASSPQPLSCLRQVPAERLNSASQRLPTALVVDNDIVRGSNAQLQEGRFARVPLLIGTTRNEGTSFVQQQMQDPIDAEQDFEQFIRASLNRNSTTGRMVQRWAELYQQEIDSPSGAGLGTVLANPGAEYGAQYGKASLWVGDLMFNAARRIANQAWASQGVPSYSFLFDAVTASVDPKTLGAAHFMEMPYVFNNTQGIGWDNDPFPSDPALRAKHIRLAELVSRMWISFTTTQSPNFHQVEGFDLKWPEYSGHLPQNMVFSVSEESSLQPDTWRTEAFDMISRSYGYVAS